MIITEQPKSNFSQSTASKGSILFVGFNGKDVCQQLIDGHYTGFSVADFGKAFYWLENQLLNDEPMPKAIISDLYLVDGNAFGFYRKLRNNAHLQHIPFIVLTNDATKDEKIKALKLGIDDFYIGDYDTHSLCDRIEFLSQFKSQKKSDNADGFHQHVNLNYFVPLFKMPFMKRTVDIIISFLALVILSPLFLLIAILIKLESRGPVFYVSKRAGTGYHIFDFYKFRSMYVGAEKDISNLMHLNQYVPKGKNPAFVKIKNDKRITKVGRFLRSTSLDELPQFINVLKGDMSLVGNRPLPLYEAEQLTKDQLAKRFLAPAGITGLWQISKNKIDQLSEDERMDLDIAYAENSSFWFDLKIIFKTFPALVQKESY